MVFSIFNTFKKFGNSFLRRGILKKVLFKVFSIIRSGIRRFFRIVIIIVSVVIVVVMVVVIVIFRVKGKVEVLIGEGLIFTKFYRSMGNF